MPTFSITYAAGDGTRLAAALGKVHNLVDAQVPPQPRSATAEEVRQWLIGRAKQLIIDVEGTVLHKAAADAVVVPPLTLS